MMVPEQRRGGGWERKKQAARPDPVGSDSDRHRYQARAENTGGSYKGRLFSAEGKIC